MTNSFFRSNSIKVIDQVLSDYKITQKINHPGMKGRAREIYLEKIINPFIVSGYNFGTGKIVDFLDNQSDQIDIIIYRKNILPPLLYDEGAEEGLFPLESVFYAIEVKTIANNNTIKDAYKKAKSLTKLKTPVNSELSWHITGFFAFNSDLKNEPEKELDRFRKNDNNFDTTPIIDFICIIDRGYWYFDKKYEKWLYYPATKEHTEIIGLIAGISNTLSAYFYSKKPSLIGVYLLNKRENDLIKKVNKI